MSKKTAIVIFVLILYTISAVYGHIAPNVKITGGTKAQREKIQKAVEEIAKKSPHARNILNRTKNLGRNVTIHNVPNSNTTIGEAEPGGDEVWIDPEDWDKFKLKVGRNKTGKANESFSLGLVVLHELKHILGDNETETLKQINKVRNETGLPKRHHYYLEGKNNTLYLKFCDGSTLNFTEVFVVVVVDPTDDPVMVTVVETPKVVDISPKPGATDVSIEESIMIIFSVPMNRESVMEALETYPEMEFSQVSWLDSKALILTPRRLEPASPTL